MRGGGGWFGSDEINFGIENKLYVHLRGPPPPAPAGPPRLMGLSEVGLDRDASIIALVLAAVLFVGAGLLAGVGWRRLVVAGRGW